MSSKEPTPQPPLPTEPTETSSEAKLDQAIDVNNDEKEERSDKGENVEGTDPEGEEPKKDTGAWQAVFSPEANAWYFWNSQTNQTTWSNPLESTASSSSAPIEPTPSLEDPSAPASSTDPSSLPPIDPDLAWLDPSAASNSRKGGTGTQAARFNARTGRFQVDQKFTPDRISDYQRGHRQQEAYYDVKGWEQQLEGKGLKRNAGAAEVEDDVEGGRKRPSSKQVEKFKQQKQEKKKKKLTSWLAN